MATILFVVAHPDDVAFGMGGTAWLLKDRYDLHVVCVTKGERGLPGRSLAATAALREQEEAGACALLGAKLTFLGKIDREVYADAETCRPVAEIIRRLAPVALLTIWPIDTHPDHSAIAEIAKKSVFLAQHPLEIIYSEEDMIGQTSHFAPDFYVDISRVMDDKLRLIRCHACQNASDRMAQAALQQATVRGRESGCVLAEGFRSLRPPATDDASVLTGLTETRLAVRPARPAGAATFSGSTK